MRELFEINVENVSVGTAHILYSLYDTPLDLHDSIDVCNYL